MKIIKRERQVRLDELLRYVWDNNITRTRFESKDCSIYVDDNGNFNVLDEHTLWKNDLYTIEEEVEITKETKLDLAEVYTEKGKDLEVEVYRNTSVNELFKINEDIVYETQFIQLLNPDGSIGELIWSKECGLDV